MVSMYDRRLCWHIMTCVPDLISVVMNSLERELRSSDGDSLTAVVADRVDFIPDTHECAI